MSACIATSTIPYYCSVWLANSVYFNTWCCIREIKQDIHVVISVSFPPWGHIQTILEKINVIMTLGGGGGGGGEEGV